VKRISTDELLTAEDVAAKFHVAVRTDRDWRYKRRLPFTRIARRLYVPVGAVEELLARNVVEPLRNSRDQVPAGQGGAAKRSAEA
jgi:hypothetical protein